MKDNSKSEFLKRTLLFSSLTDKEIEQLTNNLLVKQFKKNETILYEEDTSEFMYIILLGKVKAVRSTEEGKEIILAVHQAGEFFGEMSLIDGKTTPASVIATENSLVAIISKKDFYSNLLVHQKVSLSLLKIMCSRLRKCWDTIQLLNFNHAAQRTKMLFLMLSDEYGRKTDTGITLNIKLTHQDIADMAGLTRETVTRVLDKLQKDKEITILEKKFIHLNPVFMQKELNIKI
ncbi:MAG: Crp/Fnr family transcriptional regulator [Nitrospirae bacterium]|nr:Crp/Fnr family transcriptional regulator [Nitrospirota bacterium]MBI4849994.1 Crp/Fnr family transcriptional regulator [Nitrospirota bacterium]